MDKLNKNKVERLKINEKTKELESIKYSILRCPCDHKLNQVNLEFF